MIEGETDAEVIFNGVGTVWNGIKLMPRQGSEPGVLQGVQRLDGGLPGVRPRAVRLQRHPSDDRHRRLHRRACSAVPTWACGPRSSRPTRAETSANRRPKTTGSGLRQSSSDMPINVHHAVLLPHGRSRVRRQCRGSARARQAGQGSRYRRRGRQFPVILSKMITTGVFERFPDLRFIGTESLRRLGPVLPGAFRRVRSAQPASTGRCPCCRASTSTATPGRVHHRRSRPAGALRHGGGQHHVGPGLPALHEQLARGLPTRKGDSSSGPVRLHRRSSGSCGVPQPTLYKLPYDEPASIKVAA